MKVALLLVALCVPAAAREFPVSDQEQANFLLICDLAAQSPAIARDMRVNVAQFCVNLQRRIDAASASQPGASQPPQAPEPAK